MNKIEFSHNSSGYSLVVYAKEIQGGIFLVQHLELSTLMSLILHFSTVYHIEHANIVELK